jgi:hypothetical protein
LADAAKSDIKYVTLSYWWGRTTKYASWMENHSVEHFLHLQGISFDMLPQTLQDAVVVTRDLGVQFLWINALCIIQNNAKDWQLESAFISDIYSNAYCTIAAASSSHCEGGLLVKQDRLQIIITIQLRHFSLKAFHPMHRDLRDSSPLADGHGLSENVNCSLEFFGPLNVC